MSEFGIGGVLGIFAGFMLGWGLTFTPAHQKYENKYDFPSEELLDSFIEKCQEELPRNVICKPKISFKYAREE